MELWRAQAERLRLPFMSETPIIIDFSAANILA